MQLPRRLCAAVHAKRPKYNDADRARDERGARLRLRLFFFFEDRICNLCAPHADFIIIMNFDGATVNNNQKGGIVVRRLCWLGNKKNNHRRIDQGGLKQLHYLVWRSAVTSYRATRVTRRLHLQEEKRKCFLCRMQIVFLTRTKGVVVVTS